MQASLGRIKVMYTTTRGSGSAGSERRSGAGSSLKQQQAWCAWQASTHQNGNQIQVVCGGETSLGEAVSGSCSV